MGDFSSSSLYGNPVASAPASPPVQSGLVFIPYPTENSVKNVDDAACGCCIPQGPNCQPTDLRAAEETFPAWLFDECDLQALYVVKCGANKGKVYRETAENTYTEDTSGILPTAVPIWSADDAVWARKKDGTLYKRAAAGGAWSVAACGPVTEPGCVRCTVINPADTTKVYTHLHIVPISALRTDISAQI